jgi:hypothetical protein
MQNKGGITFHDLLCGVAVIEPGTQHGGPAAEVRCRYIFRYFQNIVFIFKWDYSFILYFTGFLIEQMMVSWI